MYDSIADAVRQTGINSKSIRDAANGKQKQAGGYKWKYDMTEFGVVKGVIDGLGETNMKNKLIS